MFLLLGIGSIEILLIFGVLCLIILPQILAILSIVRSNLESNLKLVWTLVTIFIPFGWLVYFLAGRPKKDE